MGDRVNPLAEALRIVETSKKYKQNKAIMAIITSLDFSRQRLEHELNIQAKHREFGYYSFMGYVEGVRGKSDYSFNLYPDAIVSELKPNITIAHHIVEIAAKGECLIFALNALGEEIEY